MSTAEAARNLGLDVEIFGSTRLQFDQSVSIHPWFGSLQSGTSAHEETSSKSFSWKSLAVRSLPPAVRDILKSLWYQAKPLLPKVLPGKERANAQNF